jgi:TonB family protein
MFTQLLASRPVRQRSPGGLAASVMFHGSLAAIAVYATVGTSEAITKAVQQNVVYVEPSVEPPKPVEQPAAPVVQQPGPPVVSVPVVVPSTLPAVPSVVESVPVTVTPSTIFAPGGTASAGTVESPPSGSPYLAEQVEVQVAIARNSPVPAYPSVLRSTSIAGEARFRFVVDTAGRVELSTVERVSSTHDAFAFAVRGTLPRMRFTPARVDGKPVRQLVELPFVFRVTR